MVGGSSGGEASLISSGGSVVGIGSDIGGSIRIPCFATGIYGIKTTPGVISSKQKHPPSIGMRTNMVTTGPMCRYASDLALLFKIQAEPEAYKQFEEKFESKVNYNFQKV